MMDGLPNAIVFSSTLELIAALGRLVLIIVLLVLAAFLCGRHTQRKWHTALTKLPIGAVVYNHNGRRVFANPVANRLSSKFNRTMVDQVKRAIAQRNHFTWTIRGPDDLLVQAQIWPLEGTRSGVLLTLQDFTQQQRQETNHRSFIQALSHELQTPLTSIQGHLAHIASSVGENCHSWYGSLQVARDEIERLAWLTPNVMTLLRLDAGQALYRRLHNLGVIAEEAVQQLWENAAQRGITLGVRTEPGLERTLVDRSAWKQVFLNLIDNGIKYGREGGSVTVTLRQTDGVQMISVLDDGPGIHPKDVPHLFTRLYRAEDHQHIRGSGLGLAIVKQIVELHEGEIVCRSNRAMGSGTEFQITLPITRQTEA
jgi:signal transduction histidine kinase